MNNNISYNTYSKEDFNDLLIMSQKLWKDFEEIKLKDILSKTVLSDKNKVIMVKDETAKCIAFAIFSIRYEYVEGSLNSPTGYLEGIFVETDYRKMGIAKELVAIGEKWCKDNSCLQIGSDTWLNDKDSRNFHKKIGFWEEEEVVHFLKNIE